MQARRVWEKSDFSSAKAAIWHFATGELEQAEILVTRELELSRRAGSRDEKAPFLARIRRELRYQDEAERLGRMAVEAARGDVAGELHTGCYLQKFMRRMATLSERTSISIVAARYSEMGRTGAGFSGTSRGQRLSSQRLREKTKRPSGSSKKQ